MDSKKLDLLSSHDWDAIHFQLCAYAKLKLKFHEKWSKRRPVGGKRFDDYVQEAITLIWEETRTWDSAKHPDLLDFLRGVVSSLISNDVKGVENQTGALIPQVEEGADEDERYVIRDDVTPEEILIAKQLKQEIEARIVGENDDLLSLVWYAMIEYDRSPEEISELLEIDVKDVYNFKKRIKRHAKAVVDSKK